MEEKIQQYINALLEEYEYLSTHVTKQTLFDGRELYEEDNEVVYSFNVTKETSLPDSVPILIYYGDKKTLGEVLYVDGEEIILRAKSNIDLQGKIEFSSSVHELLKKLIEKLEEIDCTSPLISSLLCGEEKVQENIEILRGQDNAISHAISNPITIIWGPPGTGKTYTLAEIAFSYYKQGKSVLIVSQSNIAVDNAMLEIKSRATKLDEGKIFRAGYSKINQEISLQNQNDIFIIAKQYVQAKYPAVTKKLAKLLAQKNETTNKDKLKSLNNEIKKIRKWIKDYEDELIADAMIVGSTISKATVYSEIFDRFFDVVLFDEASMAYVPQIVFACSLAKTNFICIGDFRQLSPIVQSKEKNILNQDIFSFLKIYHMGKLSNHEWLVMLNEQRRMHPDIAEFAKQKVYANLLENHISVYTKHDSIVKNLPIENSAIGYFDLDTIASVALKKEVGHSNSHYNITSAFVSVIIALQALKAGQKNIAIITPYRNQLNLLKSIIKDCDIKGGEDGIFCSTVHQYQGKECDVVIFDSVDSFPMHGVGKMLANGDDSIRLINVALTRAKGKFILVGSKQKSANSSILSALWQYLERSSRVCLNLENLYIVGGGLSVCNYIENIRDEMEITGKKLTITLNGSIVKFDKVLSEFNNISLAENTDIILDRKLKFQEENKFSELLCNWQQGQKLFKTGILNLENLIAINNNVIFLPIIEFKSRDIKFIRLDGKRTFNTIKELYLQDILSEKDFLLPIKHCVCKDLELGENLDIKDIEHSSIKGKIEEKNMIEINEIISLYAELFNKNKTDFCSSKEGVALAEFFKNNKIYKKEFIDTKCYFDKQEVYEKFFKLKTKKAITEFLIFDLDDLKRNVTKVRNYLKNNT